MAKRLVAGDSAPTFDTWDFESKRRIRLEDYRGRRVLLSFYRYASCPLCNLRVHTLASRQAAWERAGLELLAVFQSPAAKLRHYVGRQDAPFPLIADPEQRLYAAYGVGHSWPGVFKACATRLPDIARATLRLGYLPGSIEGGAQRIPADFLIESDGTVAQAYYGRDIGDHMPLEHVMHFAGQ